MAGRRLGKWKEAYKLDKIGIYDMLNAGYILRKQ